MSQINIKSIFKEENRGEKLVLWYYFYLFDKFSMQMAIDQDLNIGYFLRGKICTFKGVKTGKNNDNLVLIPINLIYIHTDSSLN